MLESNEPFDCEDDHIFYKSISVRIRNIRVELKETEKIMDIYLKKVTHEDK